VRVGQAAQQAQGRTFSSTTAYVGEDSYRHTDVPLGFCLLDNAGKRFNSSLLPETPHSYQKSDRTGHIRIVYGLCAGIRGRTRSRIKTCSEQGACQFRYGIHTMRVLSDKSSGLFTRGQCYENTRFFPSTGSH
jgi:hypothetical protein